MHLLNTGLDVLASAVSAMLALHFYRITTQEARRRFYCRPRELRVAIWLRRGVAGAGVVTLLGAIWS